MIKTAQTLEKEIIVDMLTNLAKDGYVVTISAGTNAFCVSVADDGAEAAISEDHIESVGRLTCLCCTKGGWVIAHP